MQRDEVAGALAAAFADYVRGYAQEQITPAFFVEADGEARITLSTLDADGRRTHRPVCTPAEQLIATVEIDYTQLRDEVMRLWTEYPLDGTDRAAKKKNSRASRKRCARLQSYCTGSIRWVISMSRGIWSLIVQCRTRRLRPRTSTSWRRERGC